MSHEPNPLTIASKLTDDALGPADKTSNHVWLRAVHFTPNGFIHFRLYDGIYIAIIVNFLWVTRGDGVEGATYLRPWRTSSHACRPGRRRRGGRLGGCGRTPRAGCGSLGFVPCQHEPSTLVITHEVKGIYLEAVSAVVRTRRLALSPLLCRWTRRPVALSTSLSLDIACI